MGRLKDIRGGVGAVEYFIDELSQQSGTDYGNVTGSAYEKINARIVWVLHKGNRQRLMTWSGSFLLPVQTVLCTAPIH